MLKQLFSVGESVMLVAPYQDDKLPDGEYLINGIDSKEILPCNCCNKIQPRYWLDVYRHHWGVCQCLLRKKPEPGGEFSVDDITKNLDIYAPELTELPVPEL